MVVRPFLPSDQSPARQLVLEGLAEHGGALDPTLNPDLNDIASGYARGLLLVGIEDQRLAAIGAPLAQTGLGAAVANRSTLSLLL